MILSKVSFMREGFTFGRMVSFQVKPFETIRNRIMIINCCQTKVPPVRVVFLFGMVFSRRESKDLNAIVRWTVARTGSTVRNLYFAKQNANRFHSAPSIKEASPEKAVLLLLGRNSDD